MNTRYRVGLSLVLFLFCTGFDRVTKDFAQREWAGASPVSFLNDLVRIQYAENPGALLGVGAQLPDAVRFVLFVVLVGLAMAAMLAYIFSARGLSAVQLTGLVFVGSGGIGNLVDRLTNQGAGIDFLNLGVGPLRTGIFNVADICLVLGVALVFLATRARPTPVLAATKAPETHA